MKFSKYIYIFFFAYNSITNSGFVKSCLRYYRWQSIIKDVVVVITVLATFLQTVSNRVGIILKKKKTLKQIVKFTLEGTDVVKVGIKSD